MTILAIDQGTTSTRAVAVSHEGRVNVLHAVEHRQNYPHPGWVEHDPLELVASVEACLACAESDVVGLANQGESCLAWHRETLEPLSPVIVWQDDRTKETTKKLCASGAEELTLARAGLPLDPYFSASKLGWILKNTPEASRAAAAGTLCLGTTDAYFRHWLTGRFETDVATASRTSLMHLGSCAWDADLCALFGVPGECLPAITPTAGELGDLRGGKKRLTASIVDQQASLRGHGCHAPGDTKITFGTGAFALAVAGNTFPDAGGGPLPTVAWSGQDGGTVYALDGGVYTAAAALNWAREIGLFSNWREIAELQGKPVIDSGLAFVPALAGLACPHWDRNARGAWFGLGLDTERLALVRAILEGIALRTAEVIQSMSAYVELSPSISVDGGMTRNGAFCQFLATCLQREIRVSKEPELTALGTAILAAEGAGIDIEPSRECDAVEPKEVNAAWIETFARAREITRRYGNQQVPDSSG